MPSNAHKELFVIRTSWVTEKWAQLCKSDPLPHDWLGWVWKSFYIYEIILLPFANLTFIGHQICINASILIFMQSFAFCTKTTQNNKPNLGSESGIVDVRGVNQLHFKIVGLLILAFIFLGSAVFKVYKGTRKGNIPSIIQDCVENRSAASFGAVKRISNRS